jgi:molybdopterin-guanine dinucleotide biosynthesis protein B
MKKIAVAFTGPSNSGKTTLITKVAKILLEQYKVAIIKNDPKDKAHFDTQGKDSYKFSQTGAETVVVSPTRTTYFSQQSRSLDELIMMLGNFDILLVEGLKTLPLPRIAIFREKIDENYFESSKAIAIDESVDISLYDIPEHIELLDLNDPDAVITWIFKNAKAV